MDTTLDKTYLPQSTSNLIQASWVRKRPIKFSITAIVHSHVHQPASWANLPILSSGLLVAWRSRLPPSLEFFRDLQPLKVLRRTKFFYGSFLKHPSQVMFIQMLLCSIVKPSANWVSPTRSTTWSWSTGWPSPLVARNPLFDVSDETCVDHGAHIRWSFNGHLWVRLVVIWHVTRMATPGAFSAQISRQLARKSTTNMGKQQGRPCLILCVLPT